MATARVDGASALVRLAAKSPLKLLVSRQRGPCVRVHSATFGGGLLAGDEVSFEIEVGAGSTLALGTSAPGKVYRSDDGRPSTQRLHARVDDGALCAILPSPLACFAQARYRQRSEIDLAPGASLLLSETFTSGRSARGERWAFEQVDSRTRVRVGGRLVLQESLLLEGAALERFGPFEAFAFVALAGPRLAPAAQALHARVAAREGRRGEPVLVAASACDWGVALRAAAHATEPLERELRALLAPALAIVSGGDAWHDPW